MKHPNQARSLVFILCILVLRYYYSSLSYFLVTNYQLYPKDPEIIPIS